MKYVLLLIVSFPFLSFSQLHVSNSVFNGYTPDSLAAYLLMNPDDSVFNTIFYGDTNAVGYFNATNTNLGLSKGFYMSSGLINDLNEVPFGPNNSGHSSFDNLGNGFSFLNSIISAQTYDASVVVIDFIPANDSLIFNFIFASEEYPESMYTNFNDVFAMFITGPGYTANQNIAVLPSGDAITTNNIHPSGLNYENVYYGPANENYYESGPDNLNIGFDGYSKVIRTSSFVEIGQVYRIVFAIADGGDFSSDSGVFISMCESCSSSTLGVEDVSNEIALDIYPNPATETVSFDFVGGEKGKLHIINSYGKELSEFDISSGNNTIDVSELESGTYFFKIVSNTFSSVKKVIILE